MRNFQTKMFVLLLLSLILLHVSGWEDQDARVEISQVLVIDYYKWYFFLSSHHLSLWKNACLIYFSIFGRRHTTHWWVKLSGLKISKWVYDSCSLKGKHPSTYNYHSFDIKVRHNSLDQKVSFNKIPKIHILITYQ